MSLCPCHSQKAYESCCKPYLDDGVAAPTPLLLMRSRYCAYATARIDYIKQTMRGLALKDFNSAEALSWSKSCQWTGLHIVRHTANTVHYIASFIHQGKQESIDENSLFEKQDDRWYYVGKAKEEKISRNAPCPCGSGKKYKRCCL